MWTVLMGVVAVAFIAGMIWLVMRINRASSQRIERRREAWRAGGCVGPEPSKIREGPSARTGKADVSEALASAEATDPAISMASWCCLLTSTTCCPN